MSRHLYEPPPWQKSVGYSVSLTTASGKPQCRHSVHGAGAWGFSQCSKPGFVQVDGVWLCKIHDPAAVEVRAKEVAARESSAWEKRMMEFGGPRFVRALREIADGHNDPRELARQVLGGLYSPPTHEGET